MSEWYQLTVEEALRRSASDATDGLSAAESQRRLLESGPNKIIARVSATGVHADFAKIGKSAPPVESDDTFSSHC